MFELFGVHWAIPKDVVDLLTFWRGWLGRHRNGAIWKAIPHCVMWCIWNEKNARIFEGCEQSILEVKMQFFQTFFEWMMTTGAYTFFNLLEFMDHCRLRT